MENFIIIAILVVIIALAGLYIYKAKKSGKKCIGCPESCSCNSKDNKDGSCSGCTGCCETSQCHSDNK